jgi:hypothetical protein
MKTEATSNMLVFIFGEECSNEKITVTINRDCGGFAVARGLVLYHGIAK